MDLQEREIPAAVGRGRGRGRGRGGGTAILPEGIWNDIVVNRGEEDDEGIEVEDNVHNESQNKDLDD